MLLIDPPAWPAHGRLWSHLVSDTSVEELHAFAQRVGIPRRGFEGDHYDVPEERYAAVVAAGATPIEGRELLKRLRDSGLRVPKRKHEWVVDSLRDPHWLPRGSRADIIASRQDNPPPATVAVRAAVTGPDGLLVVGRADGAGWDLPTRLVGEESVATTVSALLDDLGVPAEGAHLRGYVRNVVPQPHADYRWPVPMACFVVFGMNVSRANQRAGQWLSPDRWAVELGARHWWPLLDPTRQRMH